MKRFLKLAGDLSDRIIYAVGWITIWLYAGEHWPTATRVVLCAILLGFAAWYVWRFFVRPFRKALNGEGGNEV
jgi:hypothetical protein